jgi:hypothetical protein
MDLQTRLLETQNRLAERVGGWSCCRLVHDGRIELELDTSTNRLGLAAGRDLARAIEEATAVLLELDRVVAELRPAPG